MNQASKRIAVVGVAGSMLARDNLSPYTGGAGTWAQPPGIHPYTPDAIDPYAGRVTKPCAGKARCKGRTLFPQTYRLEIIRPGQRPKVLLENAPVGPFGIEPRFGEKWKRAIVPLPGGGQTFSGQVKDPFFFDFRAIALTRIGLPVAPPIDFFTPFNLLPTWLSPVTGPAKRITDSFPYEAAPDIRGPVNRTQR